MEQKLQNLLYSLPTRTAWIIVSGCAAFWLICLTGVLIPPVSAPTSITLIWFYAMLMLVLASGLAVIGAATVLVLRRNAVRASPANPVPAQATATDGEPDQLAGLGRMLDDPGNQADIGDVPAIEVPAAESPAVTAPDASAPSPRPIQTLKAAQPKGSKRRR